MSNKKKMAFVDLTNYLDWPMGGMLEYELAILNHLVNIYDVDIWGITVDGKVNKTVVINEKIYPIHIWGNAKTKKKVIPNYWRGLSIISQKKNFPQDYDVVYAHTGSCLVALCKMVDRKKTKLVYHQHGLNHRADYSMMSLIQRPLLNKALRIADLIFVVSNPESVKEYAKEMKYKTNAKFISIGSPINLDRFDEAVVKSRIAERSNFKITSFLYTGRLTIFKNARTLIEAMNRYVNEVNKEAILKIAGTGEEMKVMKKQIQTYGLEKNVQLLGAVPHEEVYDLLRESDVFVTASGGEGVSVAVLEAYASGLPIVCFKVPGLERQIIDGVTGVFAKERTADAFFNAIVELDMIRTQAANNCLIEAKKYDSKYIAQCIFTEIDSLLMKV